MELSKSDKTPVCIKLTFFRWSCLIPIWKPQEIDSNEITVANQNKKSEETKKLGDDINLNLCLLICIIGVSLGIFLEILNVHSRATKASSPSSQKPKYWVYSALRDVENENGILKHVHLVLERIGYEKSTNDSNWDLLWSHDYPFRLLYPHMHKLKKHQKVNHFPGTGFITSKVDLATTNSSYIPKAFKLPKQKTDFLIYASKNKNALFLTKNIQHREVVLKNVSEIDFSDNETFVQEYVQRPFLVDGHKFDIGVYVVLTSVNPLRAYWFKGDVLFRYCPAKYYPFDANNLDKYVIGDDYLPTWQVPSLSHSYTALGFSMKEAFDIYTRSQGKDPSKMWSDVQAAIAEVLIMKEKHIVEALKNYPPSYNFFELMRFDLIVDEDLKVYLLEANMSPNLSSAHFPPNQQLYEQVLYSLFSIVGVSNKLHENSTGNSASKLKAAQDMIASQKNIAVWGDECTKDCKDRCDVNMYCNLCGPCLNKKLKNGLLEAHRETMHRGDFRRLIPPVLVPNAPMGDLRNMTDMNRLQHLWYQGKCNMDITWCS